MILDTWIDHFYCKALKVNCIVGLGKDLVSFSLKLDSDLVLASTRLRL